MAEGDEARFEFRVWGRRLDRLSETIRANASSSTETSSTETYFVSALALDVNPKARDGKLDVKSLQGVRHDFEQWTVRMKADFPVPSQLIAEEMLVPLGLDPSGLRRPEYSLDQLISEVVAVESDLAAVTVTKHRRLFEVAGYSAEVADATINETDWQTVAIESTDLEVLREARSWLDLDGADNVSYPRAIRATLGGRFTAR